MHKDRDDESRLTHTGSSDASNALSSIATILFQTRTVAWSREMALDVRDDGIVKQEQPAEA